MRTVSALVVAMCVGTGAQTNELADVVRRVAPAVVTVHTMGFDEEGKPISSQGSGFVIRDSLIVTNHHVVENAAIATVDFADGRRLLVDLVVAADEDIDLAILTVSGALHADLSSISLSDSLPSVGDPIVVFGSPQGYSETVTHGIVSAIRDSVEIQIDAIIGHGSSGGPVVSLDGELIGVSKRGELLVTGRRRDAFGSLNFAVSSHALRDLLESVGDGVPLASWSGQEKSAVLPIALRLGEAVSDTILTAMRGAGPYLTKTSGRSLTAHALSVVSGFFRVSEADVSKFMWGPSFAPEWHSRHKAEWFTLFRDDHSETAYVDSTGHVMWWVMR